VVLNKQITGIVPPKTLDDLTDMVISLRERLEKGASRCDLRPVPASLAEIPASAFERADIKAAEKLYRPADLPGACVSLPARPSRTPRWRCATASSSRKASNAA
jgi:hypothetical protein